MALPLSTRSSMAPLWAPTSRLTSSNSSDWSWLVDLTMESSHLGSLGRVGTRVLHFYQQGMHAGFIMIVLFNVIQPLCFLWWQWESSGISVTRCTSYASSMFMYNNSDTACIYCMHTKSLIINVNLYTSFSLISQYYIKDTFGLRTLDEAGRTHIHEVPGVEHLHWPLNYTVFSNYILPYLNWPKNNDIVIII